MPRLRERGEDGVLRPTAAGDGKQKRRKSNWLATRKLCANAKSDLGCVNLPPHSRCGAGDGSRQMCRRLFVEARDRERRPRVRETAVSAKSHYQGEKDEGLVAVYVASSLRRWRNLQNYYTSNLYISELPNLGVVNSCHLMISHERMNKTERDDTTRVDVERATLAPPRS